MPKRANRPGADQDAVFLGWQESLSGAIFPMYTIIAADHPSYHSTVSDRTLRKLGLRIPETPSPYTKIGPSPWQSLGIALSYPKTAREAIESAGLDYTIAKKPVELAGLMQKAYASVRTDTGEILGIVGARYRPVQNRDAFALFDELVGKQELVYETAGVLGHGERIWILAKLPGYMKINGNDIVNKYLLLINSHDGSAPVRAKVTPIRLVCNNTLTSALQGAGEVHIRYAPGAMQGAGQAASLLEFSESLFERLDLIFNRMALRTITEEQLQEYVRQLVPSDEEGENDAKTQKVRNDVLRLHDTGWGADLARGTMWGAFNSVTEYTDHLMLDEDSATRLNSIWFGRGEQLKLKAFQLAERMMAA
jgi:phage/plasmid-like protein (TIGR03299 family)